MIRRRMVGWLVGLLVVGVMLAPATANSIGPTYNNMANLLGGASLIIDDKIFENWGDWSVIGNTSLLPDPTQIWVEASLKSPYVVALTYQGIFSSGPNETLDVVWSYDVKTATNLPKIEDMSVTLTGFGITAGPAKIQLSETLTEIGSGNLLAAALVTENAPAYATAWNPPVAGVHVVKNLAVVGLAGTTAHISAFEQTFSQVPEASTFALFGLGLAGMGLFRRRKR